MNNIEYYGISYQEDTEYKHYRLIQRKRAKRLTERYNKNAELFALLDEHEEHRQQEAFAAYKKMRAKRKLHETF